MIDFSTGFYRTARKCQERAQEVFGVIRAHLDQYGNSYTDVVQARERNSARMNMNFARRDPGSLVRAVDKENRRRTQI